jgi:hypothetical protein
MISNKFFIISHKKVAHAHSKNKYYFTRADDDDDVLVGNKSAYKMHSIFLKLPFLFFDLLC